MDGRYRFGPPTKEPYLERTMTVGTYAANAFGLFDMHGNVLEWCSDEYDSKYYEKRVEVDPTGPPADKGSLRVLRGGSWSFNPIIARSAYRYRYAPGNRYYNSGFRVACVVGVKTP